MLHLHSYIDIYVCLAQCLGHSENGKISPVNVTCHHLEDVSALFIVNVKCKPRH